MINLKGKKVIIIGGLGLIGKKTVEILLNLGALVFCVDNKRLDENKNLYKKNFFYYKIDISKSKNYNKLNKIFLDCYDPDIFINCSYPRDKNLYKNNFKQLNYQNYKTNIDKHLHSYVWLSKLAADQMVRSKKKGSIVNLSSIYGLVPQDIKLYEGTGIKENLTYCIIKAGVISHTKMLASYYGKFGIRANSVCPGGLERDDEYSKNIKNKIFKNKYFKKLAIKRFANPSDVASAVIFLSSDNAKYITGISLPVDGGFTLF